MKLCLFKFLLKKNTIVYLKFEFGASGLWGYWFQILANNQQHWGEYNEVIFCTHLNFNYALSCESESYENVIGVILICSLFSTWYLHSQDWRWTDGTLESYIWCLSYSYHPTFTIPPYISCSGIRISEVSFLSGLELWHRQLRWLEKTEHLVFFM